METHANLVARSHLTQVFCGPPAVRFGLVQSESSARQHFCRVPSIAEAIWTTIFVVEENANMGLSIADQEFVLQTGRVVLWDPASDLLGTELIRRA